MDKALCETFAPSSEEEAGQTITRARMEKARLAIRGGATRALVTPEGAGAAILSSSAMRGIKFYAPAELTVCAYAGTPLFDLEAALAAHGQMLAFEPCALAAHSGAHDGVAKTTTVGGVIATNASGARRIVAGAARDHVLGLRLINGFGEALQVGGRVMKNVTGLDLPKLLCGSYGSLGFITEVTLKVLPRPEASVTLQWTGLGDEKGVALLCAALGAPYGVTGAAHIPAQGADGARTIIRLEGTRAQLDYRANQLNERLRDYGVSAMLEDEASMALWRTVSSGAALQPAMSASEPTAYWRISLAPTKAPALIDALKAAHGALLRAWYYDWSGGLIWLAVSPDDMSFATRLRAQCAARGGHATLLSAPPPYAAHIPRHQPVPAPLAALEDAIRAGFDPAGIFVRG